MSFFPRDLAAPVAAPGPSIEWEESNCPLCDGRRSSPLLEAPDNAPGGSGLWFAVVQCQECGLCFTNPRPSPATIGRFYPAVYLPHRTPTRRKRRRRSAKRILSWPRKCSERQALPWHGQGRLLDFGCGGGSFLDRMNRQGWRVTGLDACRPAVQRVQADLGLRALAGTLPHPELRPGEFDVITMWHSLEHVHAPLQTLREAHRLLASGGKLLVAVPNIDSLPFRWFGRAWFGLDLPRHLTHFAPWTLRLMLERAGFRAAPVRMIRHSEWLRLSAKFASRQPRGPHWYRWLTVKPASRLATWYSYLTQQCDCMMVTAVKGPTDR
jgi:2-polyprenyl-3-methyl-5-hydroxy-6-metoxy-1,4-benzoquinol methylase